jgi:hypothetical protein
MGDLYALDFDGVLCDSCGESSLSAVKVLFSLSSFLAAMKWNTTFESTNSNQFCSNSE